LKVLVIDDHWLIAEALPQVLKEAYADVRAAIAHTAREALELSREPGEIHLILLDLGLPDGDGMDLLKTLRAERPETPVVVLSATDDPRTVVRALDEGAMGFIPKSANKDILIGALRLVMVGGVYLPPQVLRRAALTAEEPQAEKPAMRCRDIGLTEREAQVLALLVQGKPNKIISRELGVTEGTVKIHVTAILKALKVSNRTQAVIAVSRLGLMLEGLLAA
jgi:DNA-binding NarL/FixJ family response regulator